MPLSPIPVKNRAVPRGSREAWAPIVLPREWLQAEIPPRSTTHYMLPPVPRTSNGCSWMCGPGKWYRQPPRCRLSLGHKSVRTRLTFYVLDEAPPPGGRGHPDAERVHPREKPIDGGSAIRRGDAY